MFTKISLQQSVVILYIKKYFKTDLFLLKLLRCLVCNRPFTIFTAFTHLYNTHTHTHLYTDGSAIRSSAGFNILSKDT